MAAVETLYQTFATSLKIPRDQVTDDLSYNSVPQWDSVAHMALVVAIEEAFEVMLDTDDIIDMSSVALARQILTKYGVTLDV
jgi:acyl carrier protein